MAIFPKSCAGIGALAVMTLWATSLNALELVEARHLLRRTGFDATPTAITALLPLSRADAVDAVLATGRSESYLLPPAWAQQSLTDWKSEHDKEWAATENLAVEPKRKAQDNLRRERDKKGRELKEWWFAEMVTTTSPLTERMVLFWHNHFTSQLEVVYDPRFMYEQNTLLRKHALGNFAHLCLAIPFDPAMFRYLDSESNVASHPNENFAREVMELFTVGEGSYSEADIKEAARAFSGYRFTDQMTIELDVGLHDYGMKNVLGNKGNFDAQKIMEILLTREERVAVHISEKLWLAFINDQPDDKVVYKIAATFYRSKYQISAALRALLLTDQFWAAANSGSLVASPVDLIVTYLRQHAVVTPNVTWCRETSRKLGLDLLDPPNVKGWQGGEAWVSTQSYLLRQEAIQELVQGKANGTSLAWSPRSTAVIRPDTIQKLNALETRAALVPILGALESWVQTDRAAKRTDRLAQLLLNSPPLGVIPDGDFSQVHDATIANLAWQVR